MNTMQCMFYHNNKKEKDQLGNSTDGALTTGYPHTKNGVECLPLTQNEPEV